MRRSGNYRDWGIDMSTTADRNRFRVWDGLQDKYLPAKDVQIDGTGQLHRYLSMLTWVLSELSDKLTIERSTGLLDSKGAEIFIGDIVRWLGGSYPINWNKYHPYICMGVDQLASGDARTCTIAGTILDKEQS